MNRTQREGLAYVILATIGYAFLPVIARLLQAAGMHPLDIATWRFVFAAPALWLLITVLRPTAPAQRLPHGRLLLLGLLLSIAATTAFFGLQHLPAGVYVLLFFSYPAMVAVIEALLGEHLSQRAWAALGLALGGVALTVPDFGAGLGSEAGVGVLLALVNALTVAIYFVFNNRLLRGRTGLAHASAWVITGAMGVMLALGLARPVNAAPDAASWLYLLALALVCTVMPVFALTTGIQKLGASKAAIAGTMEPMLAVVLAALILGETVQPGQLFGGALILASIVLLQSAPRRQPAAVSEASSAGD